MNMKKYILFALVFMFLVSTVRATLAEPWVISGQTQLFQRVPVLNPAPNDIGALGQVLDLPYVVPMGCTLVVKAYGVESYPQDGMINLLLWTGAPLSIDWIVDHATVSVTAINRFNETTGVRYYFPEDTIINVRLSNRSSSHSGWVFGWYVSGELDCE